ncbi:AAA family ATPase [Brevibacillus dissolubilis]|uniref:AAA family ATPase n=1 Tax=Brevibacillus dissolubilis TaxID=1844116 RepID=UPI00210012A0|nr:AAA family ATPase [Brevibacillus dissolubilis]
MIQAVSTGKGGEAVRVLLIHLGMNKSDQTQIDNKLSEDETLIEKLEACNHLAVCGKVGSYHEIVQMVKQCRPDMVIVYPTANISLGVLCQQIRVTFPELVCLVVCGKEYAHWEPILQNIGLWTMVPPVTVEKLDVLAREVLGKADSLPVRASQEEMESGLQMGATGEPEQDKNITQQVQVLEMERVEGSGEGQDAKYHEEPLSKLAAVHNSVLTMNQPFIPQSNVIASKRQESNTQIIQSIKPHANAPFNPTEPGPAVSPKHFITVYGPKGGVGKTFLSRELAVFFASHEITQSRPKVLAVDFNLDLGTFATSLNLARTPNLFTWVQQIDQQLTDLIYAEGQDPASITHDQLQAYCTRLPFTPSEIADYIVHHTESGLHVLTSPREIRHSFDIKDYHLYHILETLKRSDYDIILLDTAPDTTDATIQALFFAERVVMVGNPVVDAIENIQRMLKLLREADYPEERIQICINRLQRKEMFTLDEMRAYFQLHPNKQIYTIPDDTEVKRSLNIGKPLMLSSGKSPSKEAIAALARSLAPSLFDGGAEGNKQDTQAGKSKKSFSLFNLFG